MDWETHVVLAGKMLEVCNLDAGAAIYSVLPAIDIKPIHYHRQYAHLLANANLILDAAIEILGSPEVAARDFDALQDFTRPRIEQLNKEAQSAQEDPTLGKEEKRIIRDRAYFYTRISEQAKGFVTIELEGAVGILGQKAMNVSRDRVAATMSLVSHCYYDTFNNPVASFIPLASNYAAQWVLWKEIDYLEYRSTFYNADIIKAFRHQMAASNLWTDPIDVTLEKDPDVRRRIKDEMDQPYSGLGLIKAMIERLGSLAPGLSPNIVDHAIRNLFGEMNIQPLIHADRELLLCLQIEKEISSFIRQKYS